MNLEDITVENIKHYIEGNANHLLDKVGLLPEQVKSIVDSRIAICNSCSYAEKIEDKIVKCGICFCSLPSKAYALESSCPKDYWKAVEK